MNICKIFTYFVTEKLKIRIKPRTLQLPITGKCNSRCTTCNVWKQQDKIDIDINKLKAVVADPYLSKVKYVGVNGGEPFLHTQFTDVIRQLMLLPKIKAIYIISNGIATQRTLDMLKETKSICAMRDVKLHLTISMDGVDDIYELVRGVPQAFNRVCNTIQAIHDEEALFCDSLTLGTTVSKRNVGYLSQIKSFAQALEIPINYHIAVPNRRIFTAEKEDYSVFHDETDKMIATEFFFGEYKYEKSMRKKLLYFQNYYFLLSGGKNRISACNYIRQDISIDENLNVYLCAKESYALGNAGTTSIGEILNSKKTKEEQQRILQTCNTCGHYITVPTLRGMWLFFKETIKPVVWLYYQAVGEVKRKLGV